MLLDSSLVEIVLFSMAVLVSSVASERVALAAALMMSFLPVARAELPLFGSTVGLRPEDVMIGILAIRAVVSRLLGRSVRRRNSFLTSYAGLVAVCALSFLWVGVAWASGASQGAPPTLYFAQKMIGSSVLLWVTWEVCRTWDALMWSVGAAIVGGLIMFGLVFFSPEGHQTSASESAEYYSEMYQAKFQNVGHLTQWNPNVIGMSFGMLLIVTAGALALRPSTRYRLLLSAAGAIFTYGLARSYTRTAMFAVAAAAVYVLFRFAHLGYAKRGALTLLVLGLCAGSLAIYTVDANAFHFDLGADMNTGSRLAVWCTGFDLLLTHPVGLGVGRAEQVVAETMLFDSAHNDWLDYGLELGVCESLYAFWTFWRLYGQCRAATRVPGVMVACILGEALMVFFFVGSLALQVFTFQKQVFVGIAILVCFVHLAADMPLRRPRSTMNLGLFGVMPPMHPHPGIGQDDWPRGPLPKCAVPGIRQTAKELACHG